MADKAAKKVINELMTSLRKRHDEAGIALKAAEVFSKCGKVDQALKIMMDFEGPTRDALDLFKAALTIKRELLSPDD